MPVEAPPASGTFDRVVPPLAQINQILVAEPNVSDSKVVADCNLNVKQIQQDIIKVLSTEKLPVTLNQNALRADQVTLTLKPEIATLKDGVVNCISYVGLKAESLYTLQLPPLTERKSVNVSLWNRGGLILTPVIDHPAGVTNAFNILSNVFVKQYRLDNPATVAPTPQNFNSLGGIRK